ncbi:MAG: hypothetical protein ABF415_09040 [Leuconostoc pseudomesenteroides]|uniref:hypothetical protein n=1 Tax=Leuconostoc pseudomesenteroides TaxID=33968 RepID=UPI0039E93D62
MNLKTANNLVLMTIVGSIILSMVIEALWFNILLATIMIAVAMINYFIVMKHENP